MTKVITFQFHIPCLNICIFQFPVKNCDLLLSPNATIQYCSTHIQTWMAGHWVVQQWWPHGSLLSVFFFLFCLLATPLLNRSNGTQVAVYMHVWLDSFSNGLFMSPSGCSCNENPSCPWDITLTRMRQMETTKHHNLCVPKTLCDFDFWPLKSNPSSVSLSLARAKFKEIP